MDCILFLYTVYKNTEIAQTGGWYDDLLKLFAQTHFAASKIYINV